MKLKLKLDWPSLKERITNTYNSVRSWYTTTVDEKAQKPLLAVGALILAGVAIYLLVVVTPILVSFVTSAVTALFNLLWHTIALVAILVVVGYTVPRFWGQKLGFNYCWSASEKGFGVYLKRELLAAVPTQDVTTGMDEAPTSARPREVVTEFEHEDK